MKYACSPNSITFVNYSSVTIECLERPDVLDDTESYISGCVLRGGRLAWLVRGATLEVINTGTGSRQASYRFGWSPNNQRSVLISSVSELHIEDGTKLLVGLKDLSGGGGIVCIFDPFVSRVIKAIEVPYAVTVVEGVTGSGGAQAAPHAFSPQLKLWFGIAVIGTEQGHCYLVDLRLDDEGEEFDEWHPSAIEVVNPSSHDMAQLRNNARTNGTHLAIEIGSDVFVTAIKYVRQTSSLLVGFNFGCFQMWNLETLTHVYSSQVGQYYSAVTHFMYQEPENDPRYCCYLWVGRGPLVVENCPETPATLTLYQLVFASKDVLTGYGVIYKELSGVGRRFEHQLTADAHHLADATSVGSKIICCYTLEKDGSSFDGPKMDDSATVETDHVRDLTLSVCVWEAPAHDLHSRPTCHLGIFDINCWYHSQMPPSIRDAMFGSKDPTCPFFAFFSLADILDAASPDGIVDVFVDAKSVSNFVSSSGSTLEQHLWPASLKLDACCLMETGLVHSKFLGVQRQILANMSKQGISCLSDAHDYFNTCYVAGLLPRNFDLSKPQDKSFHLEAVLSVALEHGLVTFITLCIKKLGAGNVTHAGCSLKLILEWAWDRVVDIKDQLDQLCVPLFDGGGGTPDEQMLSMLDNQKVQLAHLTTIFQALLTQSAPITQQGVKDLEARYNVVSIVSLYLRVVLWLIGQGLLPEQSEESITASKRGHCYPAVTLSNACESRRNDLENLSSNDSGTVGLMIDKLISTQFGNQAVSQWIAKGGSQQYPPSSIHGLCSLYLLENVHPMWKHCVVFYLLLDLCLLDTELQRNEVAAKFAKAFNLSEDLIKLIQGFWMLDHQHFEAAMTYLVDPVVKTELGPWQRSFIIKTLLAQGESQKALYLMKVMCPTVQGLNDVKLFITVLLANGYVTEAFNFQKKHQNQIRTKELLYHFFSGCQQTQNISKLLQLSLDSVEEEFLVNFLHEETFPYSKELLVMHYLQRGRYVEGIRLNELLKKDKKSQQDEKAKVRNALVDCYIRCLPRVQRKLVFGPDKPQAHQPITLTEVPRPKPLSTVVHKVDKGHPVSRAVILSSIMDKVEELRSKEQFESQQEAEAFVCTPVTPRVKSKLSDSNKVGVVFASVTKPPSEDTVSPVTENRSSPRTVTSPTFLDKRRRQFFSGAEALSLLATPPVVKVKPMTAGSSMTKPEAFNISTPQSILKITRVLRRTSPQPSPTSSPPTTRRGSSDQLLSKAVETHASESAVQKEELTTPSRRIRFASENASPPSTSPIKQLDITTPFVEEETVDSPPSNVSADTDDMEVNTEHVAQQPQVQVEGEPVTCHELVEDDDEGEAELQITAAVMDLTGDSDIEEAEAEDYSSYELDDSDAVLDAESDEESGGDSSVVHQPQITSVTVHQTTSAQLYPVSEQQSSTEETFSPEHTKELPCTAMEPVLDTNAISPPTSTSPPPSTPPALAGVKQQSPHAEPEVLTEPANELSYAFSPPAVIQTPQTKEQSTSAQLLSTPSLQYIFSPPLTRSMSRRRSSGITSTDSYGSSEGVTKVTPHQSPSNSPISFVSPVPQPVSSPRSSRKKVVRLPMHSMTLRARRCPARPTRAAKLPHTKL